MPRRRKHRHQIPTNHRRKCVDTGTVKQVVCRHITIPPNFTSFLFFRVRSFRVLVRRYGGTVRTGGVCFPL